jgi:transcription antitermination factor NusG
MYRTGENPDTRFPPGRPLIEDIGNWAVAHLKSRREKAFVQELKQENIGYFLPLFEKRARRPDNGKLRKSIVPIFPGYVSVALLDEKEIKTVRSSSHFVQLIKVKDQNTFVKDLTQIQRILENGISVERHDRLAPGDRVRVAVGVLVGLEGVVTKKGTKTRLMVSVDMFQQAVSIEIDSRDLALIGRR